MLKILALFVWLNFKTMTGYQDYLILLSPSESVAGRVKQLKDYSAGIIGDYNSQHAKAHITVQRLMRKKSEWIEPLIPKLKRDLQTLSPIILDINGFDFFDHPERPTIYAKVTSSPLTRVWFKHLRRYFSTPEFEPHITIARSIPYNDFKKLWPAFKNITWQEQFKIDKLTILRRETIGHDKSYKLVKEIPFNTNLDFNEFAASKIKAPALSSHKVSNEQFSLF